MDKRLKIPKKKRTLVSVKKTPKKENEKPKTLKIDMPFQEAVKKAFSPAPPSRGTQMKPSKK